MLPKKSITKVLRHIAKNSAVFPWFYGSWYKQVAENIWKETLGLEISPGFLMQDHFRNKGIKTYWDFEKHIQDVEYSFWEKFKVAKVWRENHIQQYRKRGYVESFFGFRREGHLSNNIILNTDIQGTAFHCLLWSLPRISNFLKDFKTDMLGQIHDAILYDLVPEELNEVVNGVRKIMCRDIRKEFDWLIVPLEVEFDITDVDGSWYTKKPLKE